MISRTCIFIVFLSLCLWISFLENFKYSPIFFLAVSCLFYSFSEVLISFILISMSRILLASNSVYLIILYRLLFVSYIFKLSYFFKSHLIWLFYFQCLRIPHSDLLGHLLCISHLYYLIFFVCLVTFFLTMDSSYSLEFYLWALGWSWITLDCIIMGFCRLLSGTTNFDLFELNSVLEDLFSQVVWIWTTSSCAN